MKKLLLPIILISIPFVIILMANSSGSPGGKTGSPGDAGSSCTQCHSGTPNQVDGWITTTIPQEGYNPGQTYDVTLIGTHTGVVKFGFELTAEDAAGNKVGTLTITDPLQTQLTNGQSAITHTSDGNNPVGDMKVWSMSWTAPDPGVDDVAFYASFNAANGNGSTSGDVIYLSNLQVQQMGDPVLVSIEPDSAVQAEQVTCAVIGEHTVWEGTSPVVNLVYSAATPPEVISASDVTVINNGELEVVFIIHDNATLGLWDLEVDELVLPEAFTVLQGEASLLSILPDSAYQGDTISAKIKGQNTHFTNGVDEVYLSFHDNPAEIIESSFFNVINDLTIQGNFILPEDASPGPYDLHVDDLMLENAFRLYVPTGIYDIASGKEVLVYPNPGNGLFTITAEGKFKCTIFNSGGQKILSRQITDQEKIDMGNQPAGLYIIKISDEKHDYFQKLIIRR